MDPDVQSTSSPERSLSTVLRGRRRKQTDDSSSPVLPGNDSLNVERGGLLRSSIDRSIDKLKDRAARSASTDASARRGSQDSGTTSKKLSKLVATSSRRRRKKTLEQESTQGNEPLGLFLTTTDGSLKTVDALTLEPNNQSSDSLPARGKSVASSLLTEDSDPESATRPTLASRQSQVGYLTLSSPLISAQRVDASESAAPEPDTSPAPPKSISALSGHPATDSDLVDQSTRGALDVNTATADSEARGRSLGDAVNANNSAISSSVRPRKPVPPGKINVPVPTRAETFDVAETPATVITPPTPDQAQIPFPTPPVASRSDSLPAALPSFAHRRVKSAAAGPSKLSVSNAPPLTPALEEVKTPGGSLSQPPGASTAAGAGFFSSLFSTTQSAVTQISNTFASSTGPQKGRSLPASRDGEQVGPTGDEEVIVTNSRDGAPIAVEGSAEEEPAVATLGSGNLMLSHLGISEPSSDASMTSREELQDDVVQSPTITQDNTIANRGDDSTAAADAVTVAYADKTVANGTSSNVADRSSIAAARPTSIGSAIGSLPGDATPPRSLLNGVEGSLTQRSGSVRSRISDRRKRRRNDSAYSGTAPSAIAAALAASHNALANPAAKGNRLTTYPAASSRRNKDFHQYFKSVPEDDCLLEDYSAALQREILLHGRLYISERHICFSSNIMGWVTTLVVSFDEVVALEKKNTAMIFPNAIVIQTLHAKNIFASLINRDGTYELLLSMWKVGHPNLKATESGHILENSTASPNQEQAGSFNTDEETDEDDEGDDADDDGTASFMGADGSVAGSDAGDPTKVVNQRIASVGGGPSPTANGSAAKGVTTSDVVSALDGFPGPATHPPTECTDKDSHYDKVCMDDIIPAPLGKVYSMLFGPLSGAIMHEFLDKNQKSEDIQLEDDKKGMGETVKSFSYSFIKKLSNPLGPKQTRCLVEQTLDAFDLERSVSVTCSTQTPDVPSGSSFVTKTKYCLTWAPNDSTRFLMSTITDWSAKSFLRGTIDKQAEAGQQLYGKDLVTFIKAQLTTKSPAKSSRTKGKSRKKKNSSSPSLATTTEKETSKSADTGSKDGMSAALDAIGAVFGPVGDILGPLISTTTVLYCLLISVTFLWLRQSYGFSKKSVLDVPGVTVPQRLAAYEELWNHEENELWSWLEDRINLDGLSPPPSDDRKARQQVIRGRDIGSRLDTQRMDDRQIADAIQVTEERLEALKAVVERKRAHPRAGQAQS